MEETELPFSTIKRILKGAPDYRVEKDSVLLVCKIAFRLISAIGKQAWEFTERRKGKTISTLDICNAIRSPDLDWRSLLISALE